MWLVAKVYCVIALVPNCDRIAFVVSLVDVILKGVFCPLAFPAYDGDRGRFVPSIHVASMCGGELIGNSSFLSIPTDDRISLSLSLHL